MFFFGFGLWMQDAEREGKLRVGNRAGSILVLFSDKARRNSLSKATLARGLRQRYSFYGWTEKRVPCDQSYST